MRQAETRLDREEADDSGEAPADNGIQGLSERARAKAYLDLWERHVSAAAVRGRGISAPWFAR